jgi:hypothetical protein
VLDPQQVLAARQGLGQGESDLSFSVVGKRHLAAGEGRALRVDLEPHGAGAVECGGGLAGGHFGHVELEGARVRDGGYGCEADSVTGVDGGCLGGAGAGGELVAADLVRGDVGHGAWDGSVFGTTLLQLSPLLGAGFRLTVRLVVCGFAHLQWVLVWALTEVIVVVSRTEDHIPVALPLAISSGKV